MTKIKDKKQLPEVPETPVIPEILKKESEEIPLSGFDITAADIRLEH